MSRTISPRSRGAMTSAVDTSTMMRARWMDQLRASGTLSAGTRRVTVRNPMAANCKVSPAPASKANRPLALPNLPSPVDRFTIMHPGRPRPSGPSTSPESDTRRPDSTVAAWACAPRGIHSRPHQSIHGTRNRTGGEFTGPNYR